MDDVFVISDEMQDKISETRDPLLLTISDAARYGTGACVTLMVNGLLISGTVLTSYEYLRELDKGSSSEESLSGEKSLRNLADVTEQKYTNATDAELREYFIKQRFIHLKDARVFGPGQSPWPPFSQSGVCFRVKLQSVDGHCAGEVVPPKVPTE